MRSLWLIASFLLSISYFLSPSTWEKKSITGTAQGTTYAITYYTQGPLVSKMQVDSILQKVDSSLSAYKSYSLISRFNHSAGGMEVDDHFRKVVIKSLEVYRDTKGVFDITIKPVTAAWGFGQKEIGHIPDSTAIRELMKCVGSKYLTWKGNKLVKKKSCIQLDVDGIAQGYSVDVLARFLENNGIRDYMVELGGEIRVKGRKQPQDERMKIGIETPGVDEMGNHGLQKIITIDSGAITTSGSYRKFREANGKRISHLFDARTGYPVENELISVTVFAPDAINADGYDNAFMAMGLTKALAFVERKKALAAYFIYRLKDGSIADTASKKFYRLMVR